MADTARVSDPIALRLLAVTQGQWGERIADNVGRFHPESWTVARWAAPRALPVVIDDPEDYLPPTLAPADLVLALGETGSVAQLIPDVVRLCGARAVIAPIDRNESLPPGLVAQLRAWLAELGVAVVFPKPFCSLTPAGYNRPPVVVAYDDPLIRAFAEHFGMPAFRLTLGAERVEAVEVLRDTACGCARFVAGGLAGCALAEVEHQAGMLHHHYPCLASMNQDGDYRDTLMHVSGHILREAVREPVRARLEPEPYLRPHGLVEGAAGRPAPGGDDAS